MGIPAFTSGSLLQLCLTFHRLLLLTTVLSVALSSSSPQCLDPNGKPVDWFIVYKLPKLRHSKGTEFGEGVAQFYLDGQNPQWKLLKNPINATDHAVYYTLQQIYKETSPNFLYMMFNDEKPKGSVSLSHGHAKGALGFEVGTSGFWLIHSAPKFPPAKQDGYQWAENACDFGQTFLCMSFSYASLGILAKQLLFYYPYMYDYNLPDKAKSDFPSLLEVVNNTRMDSPPYFSVRQDLRSLAGLQLVSFAKFDSFGADLYDALVAPTLKSPLLVETWQKGAQSIVLPTNCTAPYKVYNVRSVALPNNISFKETKDHSKYAVSKTPDGWVCVGGINRESTQFKRGGGTLCFQNKEAWKTYNNTISLIEPCKGH